MMGWKGDESPSNGSVLPKKEADVYPEEAVAGETKFFPRAGARTTFENESLESFYKPIDSYEGRHRYDPQFQWEPAEEKRVIRKVGGCSACAVDPDVTRYRSCGIVAADAGGIAGDLLCLNAACVRNRSWTMPAGHSFDHSHPIYLVLTPWCPC